MWFWSNITLKMECSIALIFLLLRKSSRLRSGTFMATSSEPPLGRLHHLSYSSHTTLRLTKQRTRRPWQPQCNLRQQPWLHWNQVTSTTKLRRRGHNTIETNYRWAKDFSPNSIKEQTVPAAATAMYGLQNQMTKDGPHGLGDEGSNMSLVTFSFQQ
jgi:hypothetical protein